MVLPFSWRTARPVPADASVIPSIPSSNTEATFYAIAEPAAELLRCT